MASSSSSSSSPSYSHEVEENYPATLLDPYIEEKKSDNIPMTMLPPMSTEIIIEQHQLDHLTLTAKINIFYPGGEGLVPSAANFFNWIDKLVWADRTVIAGSPLWRALESLVNTHVSIQTALSPEAQGSGGFSPGTYLFDQHHQLFIFGKKLNRLVEGFRTMTERALLIEALGGLSTAQNLRNILLLLPENIPQITQEVKQEISSSDSVRTVSAIQHDQTILEQLLKDINAKNEKVIENYLLLTTHLPLDVAKIVTGYKGNIFESQFKPKNSTSSDLKKSKKM